MKPRHALQLLQKMGPAWALYRAGYALRRKTGLLKRRFPDAAAWGRVPFADLVVPGTPTDAEGYKHWRETHGGAFFFPPGRPPQRDLLRQITGPDGMARTIAVADDFAQGRFLYFSTQVFDHGWPPDWLKNPGWAERHHANAHWCDYPTFSPRTGDIKHVWEPSRFVAAHWLARAYALTGDEKYPAAFWTLFETWAEQNPPNMGPNWKCGQETAIRLFAWCLALWTMWHSPATTPDRVQAMARLIAIQAERIHHNIDFAISQKNNHSMSEAIGLITAGLLFPEFRRAAAWEARGRAVLESDIARQIYDDGSFVQHSMNYHRVMLHDCLWAARLCDLNRKPLSQIARSRINAATRFLFQLHDSASGRVPNYGANDGAVVLPLSACDYTDYRPTIQACGYMADEAALLPPGPWDEPMLWLFGESALDRRAVPTPKPSTQRFDAGGYYTLRRGESWAMIRCHAYRDRPAHVDPLHLDLWHRGVNVLADSGTYKYFAPEDPAAEKFFKSIAAHNTVQIDGANPLELVSRFLWLPFPQARCLSHAPDRFVGESDAYARAPWNLVHRRTIDAANPGHWLVTDELLGSGRHALALRWHLADGPTELDAERNTVSLDLPIGRVTLNFDGPAGLRIRVVRGSTEPAEPSGWVSLYYARREPRPTVVVTAEADLPARLTTRIQLPVGSG